MYGATNTPSWLLSRGEPVIPAMVGEDTLLRGSRGWPLMAPLPEQEEEEG